VGRTGHVLLSEAPLKESRAENLCFDYDAMSWRALAKHGSENEVDGLVAFAFRSHRSGDQRLQEKSRYSVLEIRLSRAIPYSCRFNLRTEAKRRAASGQFTICQNALIQSPLAVWYCK
jgi:hypothetical protein